MDNQFPTAEKFISLTKTMLVSQLFEVCQLVEKNWNSAQKDQWFSALQSYLKILSKHKDHELSQLSQLEPKLVNSMSYKQFLAIVVPIERAFNKTVTDSDILIETLDSSENKKANMPVYFILDNIRSAFNVGSIFRTAECFGVDKIFLCGYTSTPEDAKTLKTTMNTHQLIDWEWRESITETIKTLQTENIAIYGIETVQNAIPITELTTDFPAAFIFGNEKFGIDEAILENCKKVIKIPLSGRKNSLNVGVAAGIIAQQIRLQFDHL